MKKRTKRLELRKQAIRQLGVPELKEINGGYEQKLPRTGCTLSYTVTGA